MPTITWKFVSAPEAGATVLLDMNRFNGSMVLDMGKAFDISPPALKQSFAVNSLMDGGRLTASAFENRVLKFSLGFQGSVAERIAMLAAVNKELRKPRNLIMYRPHPSAEPVYFRTMRSDQYGVANRGGAAEIWGIDCEVVAEPFAIGEMLQPIDHVLTSNDPLAASNGQRLDFPTIIGDAPAPAFVHIQWASGTWLARFKTFYLSARSHHNQYFVHSRQFVAGDLSVSVGDSFMFNSTTSSGGSAAATNFASSNQFQERGTFDSGQITDVFTVRGRYRVILRVHTSVPPSSYAIRLLNEYLKTEQVYSKTVVWDAGTDEWVHLDLGVVSHPLSETPNEFGYSGQPPGLGQMDFRLMAQRLSGTGNLEFDYVLFLPADESTIMFSTHQANGDFVLDGPNEMVYGMYNSSPFDKENPFWYYLEQNGSILPWRGAIPELVPDAPNSWYFFSREGPITDLFTFNVYYWPRWLEVATP